MPMLDVYIPPGALTPDRGAAPLKRLTGILIAAEGFDPLDPAALAVSWAFLHRPDAVYVAGAPAEAPQYKIVPTVIVCVAGVDVGVGVGAPVGVAVGIGVAVGAGVGVGPPPPVLTQLPRPLVRS